MPSIGISGASSFTGTWIASAFANAGWEVFAFFHRSESQLSDLEKKRLKLLGPQVQKIWNFDFAQKGHHDQVTDRKIDIWIHHHHYMKDFRSPRYDMVEMERTCVSPLAPFLAQLASSQCRGIIFSGSYFEPGEGGPERPSPTVYSQSKNKVWEELSRLAKDKIKVSKVVIPNPIGPLENEDRLIPLMLQHLNSDHEFLIQTPYFYNDHVPVQSLAQEYLRVAQGLMNGKSEICRPSCWVGENLEWVRKVNSEFFAQVLKREPLEIEVGRNMSRDGYKNDPPNFISVDWTQFWKEYAKFS